MDQIILTVTEKEFNAIYTALTISRQHPAVVEARATIVAQKNAQKEKS